MFYTKKRIRYVGALKQVKEKDINKQIWKVLP